MPLKKIASKRLYFLGRMNYNEINPVFASAKNFCAAREAIRSIRNLKQI